MDRERASVLHVARYVVTHTCDITTMKLEKLVYYCQAWSLAWDEVPLFDEDFEAWANGPVCPVLFAEHRGMFEVDKSFLEEYDGFEFSESGVETMDAVIDYYGDKEPHWLSELTHREAPWRLARAGVSNGEPCSNVITKESMMLYYGGLDEKEDKGRI